MAGGVQMRGLTRYPQKTMDEARVLFAQGMKPSHIAEKLDISSDVVVRRWCDEEYRQKYNERARLKARGELPPSRVRRHFNFPRIA